MRNLLVFFAFVFSAGQVSALQVRHVIYPQGTPGYIKVYVQPVFSETDILFLVDNSGSMITHQKNMALNIPVLANTLVEKAGVDLNAAVLTADMDGTYTSFEDKGTFRSILKSGSPDFAGALAQAMQVGNNGSGYERHFDALKASLSTPLLENANAGFLRAKAHLSVIFLTDAEDQSQLSPEDLRGFLTQLKGEAGVSVYSFMSPVAEADCQKDMSSGRAPKIEALVSAMGGQIFSICSTDWRAPMLSIADKMVTEVTRTIRLPTEPVRSSIEVRFGSEVLMAGDLRRGWVYDEANHSILLGDLIDWSGQPTGTEIEIKFIPVYWE